MIFENVKQNSVEWLNLRRKSISATNIGVILGICHFKTMSDLYDEKIGVIEPDVPNSKMLKGQELEPIARDLFNKELKLDCQPAVIRSIEYDWAIASLDGINCDHKHIVEIKCSEFYYRNAKEDIIPESVRFQMQWQMMVTNLDHCFYFCYWKDSYVNIIVEKNQDCIDYMIPKAYEFWKCIQNLELPQGYNEDRFVRYG